MSGEWFLGFWMYKIELLGGGWLNLMQSKNNHKHKLQQGWKFWFRTKEHHSKINKYLTAPDHTNNNYND